MRPIDGDKLTQDLLDKSFYPAIVAAAIKRSPTVNPYELITENTVYVAYAHHFDGHTVILGVYYSPDDARRAGEEWENDTNYCDWTDIESFKIQ